MKDQTWCKLGDIYITIIYPRLKESISEYFKSSLVWSWMELICLSPSRHIAMAVAFEPKKLPKVSHFSTVSWLDDAGCLFFGISFFDMYWRTLQRCWPMLAASVLFFPFVQRLHQTDEAWCLSAWLRPFGPLSRELGLSCLQCLTFLSCQMKRHNPKAFHLLAV